MHSKHRVDYVAVNGQAQVLHFKGNFLHLRFRDILPL